MPFFKEDLPTNKARAIEIMERDETYQAKQKKQRDLLKRKMV